MGGGHAHGHGLYRPGGSVVHRVSPHVKVAATLAFVFAVVATPRHAFWVFALDAALLAVVARLAAVPIGAVGRRLVIELPFVAFAVFLPLVGEPPRTEVLGLSLSEPGLWAAWNILVKGSLGVAATSLLAMTTSVTEVLGGLERLRMPRVFTAIAGFMIRYGEVLIGEARRMRIARLSRGYDPRWLWQSRALASSAGTLFVRAYERGERVHLAMLSRGWSGAFVPTVHDRAGGREWIAAFTVPAIAAVAALVAGVSA